VLVPVDSAPRNGETAVAAGVDGSPGLDVGGAAGVGASGGAGAGATGAAWAVDEGAPAVAGASATGDVVDGTAGAGGGVDGGAGVGTAVVAADGGGGVTDTGTEPWVDEVADEQPSWITTTSRRSSTTPLDDSRRPPSELAVDFPRPAHRKSRQQEPQDVAGLGPRRPRRPIRRSAP